MFLHSASQTIYCMTYNDLRETEDELMKTVIKCPVCNRDTSILVKNPIRFSDRQNDIFDAQIDGYLNDRPDNAPVHLNICVCTTCQLLFRQTFFSEDELEKIYRYQYYSEESKISTNEGFVYNNDYFLDTCSKYSLDLVKTILETRGYPIKTIFDIGGRNGFRLKDLAQNNYRCFVFDPIPIPPVNPAIQKEYVFLNEIDEAKHSSDLILLCNILEHCKDPAAVIRKCHRLLQPDGFLFIQVPFDNPQILEWLILGRIRKQNLRIDITHFLFFSKTSLKYLLAQNGFTCISLNIEFLPIIKNGNKILVINLLAQKTREKIPPPRVFVPGFDVITLKVLQYELGRIKSILTKK